MKTHHIMKRKDSVSKQLIAILVSASLLTLPLSAQPTGAKVVSGSASFKQNMNTMQITTSNKAIINYNSFNIGTKEVLNFVQPSANSVVLNRVILANPSSILGALNANGKVFLVNPAGIYFGAGSSVNANSFVATTLNISDNDFKNGNYAFTKVLDSQSRAIVQQGTISVSDSGFVVLAAPLVSNEGRIIAKAGHVVIGATDNFYIQLDAQGLVRYDYVAVKNSDKPIVLTQSNANNIVESILNTDSLKSAVSVVRDGDKIILSGAKGTILNSGTIDTSATQNADAGKIELKANKSIYVLDKSKLQSNADKVGNGGVIDIYAQDMAYSDGGATYEAKGGSVLGDGGFVEVSAKDTVLYDGSQVNMQTVDGKNGLFKIDPANLTISADSYTNGADALYQADEKLDVVSGVTISTRQIAGSSTSANHLSDASTGNSGSITMEAKEITLGSGSKLLTFADGAYSSGSINLLASANTLGIGTTATSKVTLSNAHLKGGDITISATSTSAKIFDSSTAGSNDELSDQVISIFASSPLTPLAYGGSFSDASVNIASTSIIDGKNVDISSNANSKASVFSFFTGASIGYGESFASAQTTIGPGASIKSKGNMNIKSQADAENSVTTYSVGLGSGRGSTVNVALSVTQTDTISKTLVQNGSKLDSTGAISIDALASKKINSSAMAASYEDGTVGLTAALSRSSSTTLAQMDGEVTNSASTTINAVTDSKLLQTSSNSGTGTGLAAKYLILPAANLMGSALNSLFGTKVPTSRKEGGSSTPALSAAFSYSEHKMDTTASIGGKVKSSGNVNVYAKNTFPIDVANGAKGIKTSAIATVDNDKDAKKTYAVAGAVAITQIDNKADAFIGQNGVVDAGGNIEVNAKTYMPYEITWNQIYGVGDITSKINTNAGVQDGFFTTWVQSGAAGTKTGIAGSVNYFHMNNDTQAHIDTNAKINQNTVTPSSVRVLAETDIQTMHISGVFGLTFFGSQAGKGGVGGSYLDVAYTDITKAEIKAGAKVKASALSVIADSKTKNISISEAGGNAGQYGVSGSFSYLQLNDTTYANIDGATIVTSNGVDDRYNADAANNNLLLQAKDDLQLFNVTGGITKAGNVGIGASASLNEITRDTQANFKISTYNGNGNNNFIVYNSGNIDAYSLAGTVVTDSKMGVPGAKKGDANKGGKYGIGISGDASINTINDSAKVSVLNASILNGKKDFIVYTKNDSNIRSYSGSVALSTQGSKSIGLAGSYSQNSIQSTAEATIDGSVITNTNTIDISVSNASSMDTLSASGSLATGGFQVAGSVSNNDITNSSKAIVTFSSELSSENDIKVNSEDSSAIKTIAGAVGFGGKAGIGASVALNNINNTLEASVTDSQLNAKNDIIVNTKNTSTIDLIVASLGVGTSGMAGSVAIGLNNITNSIKSWVKGTYKNGIDAMNDVKVSAVDSTTITSKAGQLALASKVALGATVMQNSIQNTISADIENSDVSTKNSVYVQAKSEKNIKNQSIAGAVSGAVAINGSVLINTMKDTTDAHISNSKVHTDGSIALEASEINSIDMFSASLSASKFAGVGAVVALNKIDNNIKTYIDGGSDIYAGGATSVAVPVSAETSATQSLQGLDLISYSEKTITSKLASIAGGVGALNGVVSVNLLNDNLDSYIDSSNINTNNAGANAQQAVRVRALVNNNTEVLAGAVGVGGVSVGGTSDTTLVTNRTNAYVKDSFIYAKKSFDVNNQGFNRINNIVVAGSGGGTAAIAGSVEVLNVDTANDAYVSGTKVFSEGDTNIIASDTTNLGIKKDGTRQSIVTGAAALGGILGVGGSVGVVTVTQDVKAHADASELNTKNSTNILSTTKADLYTVAASGAISSGYVGAAGSVTVNSIDSSSQAYTSGANMLINQDATYETVSQDVNVKADSTIALESKVGAVGVSAGAGVGASIDVATVKNTVLAKLGDSSKTSAQRNIAVEASSDKTVTSNTLAVSGGVAGLSGAVSVVNINSAINNESADASDSTQSTTNNMLGTSRVGSQLDDATLTADVDTQTQAVNVNNQFDKNAPVSESIHAKIGDLAIVKSGANTGVKATDSAKTTILSGAAAGGVLGAGGAVAIATIDSDTRAIIGVNSQVSAGSLDITSNFNSKGNSVKVYTGAIGFVGLGAAVSKLAINYETDAYADAGSKINNTGNVNIKAKSDISSTVEARGAAVGAYAANAVVANMSQKGNTQANLGANTQVNAANLNIDADYFGDVNAYTLGASGGIVSGSGSSSTVNSQPTVIAEIRDGSKVTISGATDLRASASEKISSKAEGLSVGALAVGVSISDATSKPTIKTRVGSHVTFSSGSLTLRAYLNRDASGNALNNTISSKAFAAAGALIGGSGAVSSATNDSSVKAEIGALSSVTTQNDLDMNSISDTNVIANSDGHAYGVLSVGATKATIVNNAKSTAGISNKTLINSSRDINIYAYSKTKSSSDIYGGAGGLLSGAGTLTKTTMINNSNVAIGSETVLNAKNGDINIAAVAHNDAYAKSDIETAGVITVNVSQADISTQQNIDVLVSANAKLSAKNINLTALSEKLHAVADSRSKTIAADSFSTANSNLNVVGNLDVRVKDSAELHADTKVNILSSYLDVYTKSKAFGTIKTGFTGSIFANARNDLKLDSDILIENNAKIYSNDVSLKAISPKAKKDIIYLQDAEASAATVINYVLTTVEKISYYTSWIPFIGKLIKKVIKKVLEWVRHVLNSDTKATTPGSDSYGGVITMNGNIYQLPSGKQSLIIASDGTTQTQGDIIAQVTADEVIVNDLINKQVGKITLESTNNIQGNGNIIMSNAYPEVNIQNNSNKKLTINQINMISDNQNQANLNIKTASDTTNFNISSGLLDHTLKIENFSTGDIVLNNVLNNYAGDTIIHNTNGNIYANSGALIKTKTLNIVADRGNIGSSLQRVEAQFDTSGASNPSIVLNSFGATYLGLRLKDSSTVTPASNYLLGTIDITDITANKNIDLKMHQAQMDVATYNVGTGLIDYVTNDVKSNYKVQNIKSKDDIALSGENGVSVDLAGSIASGEKDLLVAVDATDPSQTSSEYVDTLTASILKLKDITQRGGHINVNLSDGTLSGSGSATLLDGYMHLKVKNDTNRNLQLQALNTNERVNGSFKLNGVDVTNLAVNNVGYTSGEIAVENLGTGTTTMLSDITNSTGLVSIKGNNGLINPNDSLILAKNISLDGGSGNLGSANNFIRLNGDILAKSDGNVYLNGINNLKASNIIANGATAYLKTDGAITATNIKANSLELQAVNNIDADLEVTNLAANSQTGSINLVNKLSTKLSTVGSTVGLNADKDITLKVTDGSINSSSSSQVDIKSDRFIAQATKGIGSTNILHTDVNSLDVKNSLSGDIVISDKGSLVLKDIDGDNYSAINSGGAINISSNDAMLVQNNIFAKSDLNLVSLNGAFSQASGTTIKSGHDIVINAKNNILASNIQSKNNIDATTSDGDILGDTAVAHNFAADNKLSLIATKGVVGAVGNIIGIVKGTNGVHIQANGSKNILSVYIKGVDFPVNPHKNLDLAVLNNRPVSGSRITDYTRVLHNGSVVPKIAVGATSATSVTHKESDKDYIAE